MKTQTYLNIVHYTRLLLALISLCGILYFAKHENVIVLSVFASLGWVTVLIMLGEQRVRLNNGEEL